MRLAIWLIACALVLPLALVRSAQTQEPERRVVKLKDFYVDFSSGEWLGPPYQPGSQYWGCGAELMPWTADGEWAWLEVGCNIRTFLGWEYPSWENNWHEGARCIIPTADKYYWGSPDGQINLDYEVVCDSGNWDAECRCHAGGDAGGHISLTWKKTDRRTTTLIRAGPTRYKSLCTEEVYSGGTTRIDSSAEVFGRMYGYDIAELYAGSVIQAKGVEVELIRTDDCQI